MAKSKGNAAGRLRRSSSSCALSPQQVAIARQFRFQASLLDQVRNAIIATDLEGNIVYWNKFAKKMYQWSAKEALGKNIVTVIVPAKAQALSQPIFKHIDQKGYREGEFEVRRKDGSTFTAQVYDSAIKDPAGKPIGYVGVSVDIEDRKRMEASLRESEQRFAAFMENVPGFTWIKDNESRYVYLSRRRAKLCKHPRQWLGKTDRELWPPAMAARYMANDRRVIATRRTLQILEPFPRKGGRGNMLVTKFPIFNHAGDVQFVGGIGLDNTEREAAQRFRETLAELGQKLNSASTPLTAGRIIMEAADELFGWDACVFSLYDAKANITVPVLRCDTIHKKRVEISDKARSLEPSQRESRILRTGGKLLLRRKPAFSRRASPFGDKIRPSASILAVAIRHRKQPVGILSIQSYTFNAYARESLRALQTLADYCGGALERIRAEMALKEHEAQLERSKEQLQALTARLELAREEESLRISREIHDELGQSLSSLNLDLSWLRRKIFKTGGSVEIRRRLKSMESLLQETGQSVQRIAANLRSGMVEDLGLTASMEWHLEEFSQRSGIACRWASKPQAVDLPERTGTAVWRIFQEILTNVARHAKARSVVVRLSRLRRACLLEVSDNGKGFDESVIALRKSLGLVGMKERAASIGGDLRICSAPGKGTRVSLKFPV